MASSTITFDPDSGVPDGANLTIYGGTDFSATFNAKTQVIQTLILQVTQDLERYLNLLALEHQLVVAITLPSLLV